jgi:hypothetical protein
MKNILYILVAFFSPFTALAQKSKTEVIIISTLHGAHKINPNYSYDALFAFIDKHNPDIIGVEIREEDLDSSVSYLKRNYPYEMYECISKYSSKKVVGFDWLGDDLSGKSIPINYWKETSTIKKLQQKLSDDTILLQKLSVTNIIQEEKKKLALNASLQELNDGRYDLINYIYYSQLQQLLIDTEFKALSDFYTKRDEMIASNIVEIIKNNKGKKLIFLLGADHRYYTHKKVSEVFKDSILLAPF